MSNGVQPIPPDCRNEVGRYHKQATLQTDRALAKRSDPATPAAPMVASEGPNGPEDFPAQASGLGTTPSKMAIPEGQRPGACEYTRRHVRKLRYLRSRHSSRGHVASAIMVRIQKSVGPLALPSFLGNDFPGPLGRAG